MDTPGVPLIELEPPGRPIRSIHFFQDKSYVDLRLESHWNPDFHEFVREGKVLGTAVLMQRRLKVLPASVLMVLFGPKIDFGNPEDVEFAFSELARVGHERKAVYVAVQPYTWGHVGLEDLLKRLGYQPRKEHILYRHTVLVDLSQTEEGIFKTFGDSLKSEIRRSQKNHVEIRVNEGEEAVGRFYELYRGSYRRSGGGYQSVAYFEKVWNMLASHREVLFAVAYVGGKPAATALMALIDGNMVYLCGGTASEKELVWPRPNEALHWEMIRLAKRWGCRFYDLGGANPEAKKGSKSAGISHFKQKFGNVQSLLGFFRYECNSFLAQSMDHLIPIAGKIRQVLRPTEETDYNLM